MEELEVSRKADAPAELLKFRFTCGFPLTVLEIE